MPHGETPKSSWNMGGTIGVSIGAAAIAAASYFALRTRTPEEPPVTPPAPVKPPAPRELTDRERFDAVTKTTTEAAARCEEVVTKGRPTQGRKDHFVLVTDAEPGDPVSLSMRGETCTLVAPTSPKDPALEVHREDGRTFTPQSMRGFEYTDTLDGVTRQAVTAVLTWLKVHNPSDERAVNGTSYRLMAHLAVTGNHGTTLDLAREYFVQPNAPLIDPQNPGQPVELGFCPSKGFDACCYPPTERAQAVAKCRRETAEWLKLTKRLRREISSTAWGYLTLNGDVSKRHPLKFDNNAIGGAINNIQQKIVVVIAHAPRFGRTPRRTPPPRHDAGRRGMIKR